MGPTVPRYRYTLACNSIQSSTVYTLASKDSRSFTYSISHLLSSTKLNYNRFNQVPSFRHRCHFHSLQISAFATFFSSLQTPHSLHMHAHLSTPPSLGPPWVVQLTFFWTFPCVEKLTFIATLIAHINTHFRHSLGILRALPFA
jgi:hypothetical protein